MTTQFRSRHTTFVQTYAVPNDLVRVVTTDVAIFSLADRLWERTDAHAPAGAGGALEITIDVRPSHEARPPAGREEWRAARDDISVRFGRALALRIDFDPPGARGRISQSLLRAAPDLAARLLLEAPMAELLARRNWMVLHAGTIVGPLGAVVVRGRSGQGKSTLVAAGLRHGLDTLGDESVLVSRDDPDALAAAVRELRMLPDNTWTVPDGARVPHGALSDKHRVDLFENSAPRRRTARRRTTVLLGDRHQKQARLTPLGEADFVTRFAAAAIEQERWAGDPDQIAQLWAAAGGLLLEGANDLDGAVRMITGLVRCDPDGITSPGESA